MEHAAVWISASSYLTVPLVLGLVLGAILGFAVHPSVGVMVGLVLLITGVILQHRRHALAETQRSPMCATAGVAVEYVGWDGARQVFDFSSTGFAARFAAANERKLLNVSPELRATIETTRSTPSAQETRGRGDATGVRRPETDEDRILGWIAKIETIKGNATRRAATAKALTEITSPTARERFIVEVSRINVQAALDKADALKTVAAKRRMLQTALDDLRHDDVADELQAREIAMLEEALRDLSA